MNRPRSERAFRVSSVRRYARGSRVAAALLLALHGAAIHAQIREEPYVHLGVATCASTTCHGKFAPATTENVRLNEYSVWAMQDRHARAYRTLESEASRQIAAKLGLASAQTAQVCLDCHADNVPPERRGPEFQIRDGVGCEACHGGAERWITSHTEPGVTHQSNLAQGMYATEAPVARAEICFSCHLGTSSQFATHELMGAGHPRLRFELESSTVNQPAHYDVDDDYRERKGTIPTFNLWLTGQLKAANRFLTLVKSDHYNGAGGFPELAFYDCHSCHHEMDDARWSRANVGAAIPPGTPRLQNQHFLMLEAVSAVLEPATAGDLRQAIERFVASGRQGSTAVTAAADTLLGWIQPREARWPAGSYEAAQVQAVRRRILSMAAAGRLADQASAEQAFLAVESLTLSLGANERQRRALDQLFAAIQEDTYRPAAFIATAGSIVEAF